MTNTRLSVLLILLGVFWVSNVSAESPPKDITADKLKTVSLDGTTYEYKDNAVVATREDQEQWRHQLLQQHQKNPGVFRGIIQFDGLLAYCVRNRLYFTHPSGVVKKLVELPESCLTLKPKQGVLSVQIGGVASKQADSRRWVDVTMSSPTSMVPIPSVLLGRLTLSNVAQWPGKKNALIQTQGNDETFDAFAKKYKTTPKLRAILEEYIKVRAAAAKVDPTNPWLLYWQGVHQRILGDLEGAATSFESLLKWEGDLDVVFVKMANHADSFDPELADKLFERGMRGLLKLGYTPETTQSLVHVVVGFGLPYRKSVTEQELQDKATYAIMLRRALRLADFAPRVEGGYHFWRSMVTAAKFHKDSKHEAFFKTLALEARPYVLFGSNDKSVKHIGLWMNIYLGGFFALFIVGLLKLVRVRNTRVDPEAPLLARVNPLARLRRTELLGLLVAVPLVLYALQQLVRGVVIIGIAASAPLAVLAGNFSDGQSQQFLTKADQKASIVRTVNGLGLVQRRAPLSEVEAVYKGSTNAQDLTNLGVARFRAGKTAEANVAWEQALKASPGFQPAMHNLGKTIQKPNAEIRRLHKYQIPQEKVLASLSSKDWASLWRATAKGASNDKSILERVSSVNSMFSTDAESYSIFSLVSTILGLLMVLLAMLGLIVRGEVEEFKVNHKVDICLAMFVPGVFKHYGILSFIIGVCMMTLMVGAFTLAQTKGVSTNILEAIAAPAFGKFFGVKTSTIGQGTTYRMLSQVWYLVVLFNAVLVAGFVALTIKRQGANTATASKS